MSTRIPESEPSTTPRPESSPPDPDGASAPASPATTTEPSADPSAAAPTEGPAPDEPISPAEVTSPVEEAGFSAAELREISTAITEAFPLVTDATELVLVDVDPHRVHAHWIVQPADLAAAQQGLGPTDTDAELVLRFHDLTVADGEGVPVHAPLDIEVDGLQNDWYIDLWSDAGSYLAELGLRGSDGQFIPLVQSNPVQTPRAAEAPEDILPTPSVVAKLAMQASVLEAASGVPLASVMEAASGAPVASEGEPGPPADRHPRPVGQEMAHPAQASDRTLVAPAAQVLEAEFPQLGGGEPTPPSAKDVILIPAVQAGTTAVPEMPAWASSVAIGSGGSEGGSGLFMAAEPSGGTATAAVGDLHDRSLAPGPSAALAPHFPNVGEIGAEPGGERMGDRDRPPVEVTGGGHGPAPPVLGREATASPPSQGMGAAGFEPGPSSSSLLSYSSSTLARPSVDLELHVELHVYGRARPGADLNLFGRRVALRPDGSFSFRRPLRNGAIVVPVLFADEGGPLEDGEA